VIEQRTMEISNLSKGALRPLLISFYCQLSGLYDEILEIEVLHKHLKPVSKHHVHLVILVKNDSSSTV
jgi:hypothetical protein